MISAVKKQKKQYSSLVSSLKTNSNQKKRPIKFPAFDLLSKAKAIGNNPAKLNLDKVKLSTKALDTVSTMRVIEHSEDLIEKEEEKIEKAVKEYLTYPESSGISEIKKLANLEKFFIV